MIKSKNKAIGLERAQKRGWIFRTRGDRKHKQNVLKMKCNSLKPEKHK